jgi:hypothetical protein
LSLEPLIPNTQRTFYAILAPQVVWRSHGINIDDYVDSIPYDRKPETEIVPRIEDWAVNIRLQATD